ncbi:hypothetical protein P7K49_040284, partial [Saguinus oedipus]
PPRDLLSSHQAPRGPLGCCHYSLQEPHEGSKKTVAVEFEDSKSWPPRASGVLY